MSSCWCVHTEQCDDSNSFPRAGLCISAGLSDRRASGVLFRSGITKVSHLEEVLEQGREGKSSASLVATRSICIQSVEEEEECPATLDPPKNRAHTDQTKAVERQTGLFLPCLSRYLRVHWEGWQHVIMPTTGTPASDEHSNLYRSL